MLHTLLRLAFASGLTTLLAGQNQQATVVSTKDNTLYFDATGSLSNGAGSRMFAGNTGALTNAQTRRALVAFDLVGRIPPRSRIVSATLTLSVAQAGLTATPVDLHRVLANWGEGTSVAGSGQGGGAPATAGDATWVHRSFPTSQWTSAGGDFQAAASATISVGGPGSYTWASNPQIVADVQLWLDQPARNCGWLLRGVETGSNTAKAFETKESLTPANRPQLVVVYSPPAAGATPSGTGCTGGGAAALALGAVGLPRVPNPSFALGISGGPAGGPAAMVFALDLSPVPLPIGGGCFVYVNPLTLALSLPATPPSFPLPIPNDTTLLGAELALQTAAVNLTTFALATSNALVLLLGT